jgi:RNA recognition motif-containing protein
VIVCILSLRDLSMNIYVGNLAFTVTDDDLRQLFEPYGLVEMIRVITDHDTGRAKGFGFVTMPNRQAATAALQGQALAGRALTVAEAKPQEPRREPRRTPW